MFYSQHIKIIDNPSSYLDSKQVFTGNYWDEFGLTSFLIPDNARVLMLGLGTGGGIRPLMSSTKNIDLTCVDLDGKSTEICRDLFTRNFPNLKFEIVVDDAKTFLEQSSASYDFIWLDIYRSDSYSELYFEQDFHDLVKLRLTAEGVLAVNAYGIPTQFKPFSVNSVQRETARVLQNTFSFVGAIPNRRNQTIIASAGSPKVLPSYPHPELSALDKRSFLVQGVRVQYIDQLATLDKNEVNLKVQAQFVELDRHMKSGWLELIERLKSRNLSVSAAIDLLALVQDAERAKSVLDDGLMNSYFEDLDFIPIVCSGESFLRDLDVEWVFRWMLNNYKNIPAEHRRRFVQVWLTQAWSLILNPSRKYRPQCFQIFNLFEEFI
jgi:spermidine synthase